MTRRPLSAEQISHVFRLLAEEHARQREPGSRETAWRLLAARRLRADDPPRRGRQLVAMLAAAAAVLALLGAGLFITTRDAALEYSVSGGSRADGLVTTQAETATLTFSDESAIEVDPHSAVRITVLGAHRAQAQLARGRLRVRVKHSADTDWRFLAGPHEIRVVGTRFDVEWRPELRRFSIVMHEGRVLLTGGERPAQMLSAGQIVVVEPPPVSSSPPAPPASAIAPSAPPEPSRQPAQRSREASWSELVAKGRFAEVVKAAESQGIAAVVREKNAVELRALAQAARYTGNNPLAVQVWKALRSRYSGEVRSQAAFFLARTYEGEGKTALAIQSYDDYLRESATGVYAAEALGRKLALLSRAENGSARSVAREYLRRFPNGSYARTARDILAGD